MKKNKALITSVVALSALLLTACPNDPDRNYFVEGDYLTGKPAKRTYNAYIGSAPTTLDARVSQSGENVTHLANFEDCLVMNDGYGILRKSLAETAERNADGDEFRFTVKENIPWVTCDGAQYVYRNKPQYVTVDDFVTTAKNILDYTKQSEIYYMYTLFIENAWEYYCYTMMTQWINEQKKEKKEDGTEFNYASLVGNDALQAEKLTELVKRFSNEDPKYEITAERLPTIADFSEVGVSVKTINGKRTLVYKLRDPADYFPTVLTYTPYTPINSHFLAAHPNDYGKKRDTILYCGPYLLKEFSTQSVKYVKNEKWHKADTVHVTNVNYTTADASLGYKEQREAFDRGEVDGFSLSQEDEKGWNTYIAGPDGKGTIQKPYSGLVNNRELDDVDYTYHFVLNPNRSTEDSSSYENSYFYSNDFMGGKATDEQIKADIENTNRALHLQEVRKLILNGFDLASYNLHYNAPERDQYQINTFTPRGYVYDGAGIDYVDYYYAYYAEQKGLIDTSNPKVEFKDKVAAGKAVVGPQQIRGVNYTDDTAILADYSWLSMTNLRERAQASVNLYNATAEESEKITLPVNIEFLAIGAISPKSTTHERNQVQQWNERANACTLSDERATATGLPRCKTAGGDNANDYPYFSMRRSTIGSESKLTSSANNGYYTIYTGWGWVGDYADPLTYVHCYATNGEMSKMSGNNDYNLPNYSLNAEGTALTKGKMYESYNAAVKEANAERTSSTERYKKFAQVEYQLLNELYIMRPVAMYTQGWAASVSRAAGYENPSAHYGLADNILAGMWVLKEVPSGKERADARALREEREKQYLAEVGNNAINGVGWGTF